MAYIAKDRSGLEYYFDAILRNNYRDIKFKRRFSYGHNAVKSYVVEVHDFESGSNRDTLVGALRDQIKRIDADATLSDTQEESLLYLEATPADFYVDISRPRYPVLHTAEPTKVTDPFIRKFHTQKGFDSLWLPVPLLLETTNLGRLWGVGVAFRESLQPTPEEFPNPDDPQDISMNVQRHFAAQFMRLLFDSPMARLMGLSRIAILRSGEGHDDFIIDDIKYSGKLTAKGTSFSRHLRLVHDLVGLYQTSIGRLEAFGMSFNEGWLGGNPVTISFSAPISPVRLIEVMFDGDEPFRLWGIEEQVGSNAYRVYAVDLHHGNLGNKLTFEITSEFMRVTFPAGACANTLLRMFANLNHHVDAMARMEVLDYVLDVDLFGGRLSQHHRQHDVPDTPLS